MIEKTMIDNKKLNPQDIRILFMGTPDFAVAPLNELIKSSFVVAAAVTQPDKPVGRRMVLTAPPVKTAALSANVEVIQPEKLRNQDFIDKITDIAPDLIVTAAYGKILPASILKIPRLGCINVHASLLPKYRGAAPIQWCIFNGDTKTGITFMEMDVGMDTGAIIQQDEIDIPSDMCAGELTDRLSQLGAEKLPEVILKYCNNEIVAYPQNEMEASYVRPITKDDCIIDWNLPAVDVYNRIRGLSPFPTAYTTYKGKRLKICEARIFDDVSSLLQDNDVLPGPGSLIRSQDKKKMYFMCNDCALQIVSLQMEGSKQMEAAYCAHNFDIDEILGG